MMDTTSSSARSANILKGGGFVAGLPHTGHRAVKRRASKACQCCRARKVRCNVVEHGAPCTNCRLDEVECLISESKRRKKSWGTTSAKPSQTSVQLLAEARLATATSDLIAARIQPISSPTTNIGPSTSGNNYPKYRHAAGHACGEAEQYEQNCPSLPPALPSRQRKITPSLATQQSPKSKGSEYNGQGENVHGSGYHVPHLIYQSQGEHLASKVAFYSPTFGSQQNKSESVALAHSLVASRRASTHSDGSSTTFSLPSFLRPLPATIGRDEVSFLEKKGALTIPSIQICNHIFKAYVTYVHGFAPLLDLREFYDILNGYCSDSTSLSLLLFQAVMFAGSAFVDVEYLYEAGFSNRRAARQSFYERSRLLYDHDYETNRINLVQALLLMTYWYESPDEQKDMWHWMGIAISLSHTIGLHQSTENARLDIRSKRLWKRIWWTCYTRDRLVALGMRRPTRIRDQDFDVPMLTLEDFDIGPVVVNKQCHQSGCGLSEDPDGQKQLAVMFIEMAKLCICIGAILSAQYSVSIHGHGTLVVEGNARTTMMLLPRKTPAEANSIRDCDASLASWGFLLPDHALRHQSAASEIDNSDKLNLHRGLLHLVYQTAVIALHRPQITPLKLPGMLVDGQREAQKDTSRQKVDAAAAEITKITSEFYSQDVLRFLPITAVSALLQACIIHLRGLKSANDKVREVSSMRLAQSMQALLQLHANYAAAEHATAFIEAAARREGVELPSAKISKRQAIQVAIGSESLDTGDSLQNDMQLTPPPEMPSRDNVSGMVLNADLDGRLSTLFAATPPWSDTHDSDMQSPLASTAESIDVSQCREGSCLGLALDPNFDALVNLNEAAEPSFSMFGRSDSATGISPELERGLFGDETDWLRSIANRTGMDELENPDDS